jgi:multidrug efflux pump
VALTLTPMMSARLLRASPAHRPSTRRLSGHVSEAFARLLDLYRRALRRTLQRPSAVALVIAGLLIVGTALFVTIRSELAPVEDSGSLYGGHDRS